MKNTSNKHSLEQVSKLFGQGPHKLLHNSSRAERSTSGLHNSERSKGQIININLQWAAKYYFISMWRFRCSRKEILRTSITIWGRAFAAFSTIEKALAAARKALASRMLCRPVLCTATASGYRPITFYQINKCFVSISVFTNDKVSSRAGWNGFAGRIWLAGRSLDTAALEDTSSQQRKKLQII